MIQAYVDGSYSRVTNKTSGAVAIITDSGEVLKKSFIVQTEEGHSWNIDGECHAALMALKIITGEEPIGDEKFESKDITLNYDYVGIEKWAANEWTAKSKISRYYVSEYRRLVREYNLNVTFNKIKAHTGDVFNEMVDDMARVLIDGSN